MQNKISPLKFFKRASLSEIIPLEVDKKKTLVFDFIFHKVCIEQ